jgi:recombination protein RecT
MANNNLPQLKAALNTESIKNKFNEMLGKKSAGFITSITTVVQNSDLLQKAEVNSIILAAAQAASLDLPINPNLGFSAIIPFNDKKNNRCIAQFQIMRDGWVDLCLRTGQFEYIANEIVYEGELVEKNRFTDTYVFDETKRKSNKIIGYMASFKLVNGYRKTVYMTVEEAKAHGKQYSQTFKKGYGLWADNFNAMALKTALKMLLKKFAPKSIESIAKAIESDQASFVGDIDNAQAVYVDNAKGDKQAETVDFEEVVDKNTGEVEEPQAEIKAEEDEF